MMSWEVERTDEFEEWWGSIAEEEQEDIALAVEKLEEKGPSVARPLADTLENSWHANMKELRPPGSNIRVFFAFDPRRRAISRDVGGNSTTR